MLFRLDNIYKSYAGQEILRGCSFQINPGERVGLVGRNGAGKTTLFRLITGEDQPDSGEVIRLNTLKLGLLEQHVDFTPKQTVHDFVLSAFEKLHKIEAEMRQLETQMAAGEELNAENTERAQRAQRSIIEAQSDQSALVDRYGELQHEFEELGGFTMTARAEAVLLGMNFPSEMWQKRAAELSGGQKNRLGLARLLLSDVDVLLLDEPTNHLDIGSVGWLEDFLVACGKAYVIISHDRYFLDRACSRTIELDRGQAVSYKGNYSDFVEQREERRAQQQRKFENQQAFIAKTQDFIRRNIAGQKTKMAKSRRNMLERMDRVESTTADKGGGQFALKQVERSGTNVLTTDELTVGYGDFVLAKGVELLIRRGEALGVIGENGSGKTTFVKTILGQIKPLSGSYQWGSKVNIGYYSQQLEGLNLNGDVLSELRGIAAPTVTNGELRSFLARFLFTGEDIEKPVRQLSGGEKGRLSLAKLIYSQVNVLVLDEPTNHLDIPSREALEAALMEFSGTIIVISHDRYFLDEIADRILFFDGQGLTDQYNGSYSEFQARFSYNSTSKNASTNSMHNIDMKEVNDVDVRALETSIKVSETSLSKNQRQKLADQADKLEKKISELEEELAALTLEMNRPEISSDITAYQSLSSQYQTMEKSLEEAFQDWEKVLEKLA
jgi:ATP-binding cassette subfamily F protein 3